MIGAEKAWAQNGIVEGTAGNDTMTIGFTDADGDQITQGNDVIDAGGGNDTIRGGNGADVITAGGGDDVFQTYFHESFGDTLNGGDGIDIFGTYANSTSTNNNFDVWLNAATTLNSIERIDGSIPGTTDKELRLDGTGTFDLSSVTHFLDITDVYSNATTGSLTLLLPNLVSTDRFFLDDGADIEATIGTVSDAQVTIFTGTGSDNITTGAGYDTINSGNSGTDVINAGEGYNMITTSSGSDTVTAGNGGNAISTGNDNDTITTGTGVDTLRGGNGADVITAGGGDDVFQTYFHESLGDTLNGGDGIDTFGVYLDTTSTSPFFDVWINAATTLNSIERIDGSIPGTTDKELRLDGTGTFDLSSVTHFLDIRDVYSNATTGSLTLLLPNLVSTDRFFLDDGADIEATIGTVSDAKVTIFTGIGSDNITTGAGNDIINSGNSGTDVINAGEGYNMITTSSGSDTVTAGNGGNAISTGNDNDTITTGTGVDTLRGGNGADVITAGGGDDVFQTYFHESFGDTLNGGDGIDIFGTYANSASTSNSNFDVWLNAATTLNSIERIDGSIPGTTDKELRLDGTGTFDLSSVTHFLDIRDVYSNATTGSLTLLLPNLVSTDRFFLDDGADIEATIGTVSDAKVTIFTGIGSDNITTGAGNDIINSGNSGTDVINAGEGYNMITTSSGSDTVTAGNGGNAISTGNDNDTITTGTGVDTLRGGNGADVITAGGGDDVFQTYFHESFGDTLNGGDGIDILGTYANSTSTDNNNFDVWLNAATTLNSIERIDGSIPGTTDKELRLDGTGTFDLSSVTHFLDITDVYSNATTGSLTLLLPNLVSTDRFFLDDGADIEATIGTVSDVNTSIYTGTGSDNITTGAGNDTINSGNSGTDVINAGEGYNMITTSSGSDTVTAGNGGNTISTGNDNDTITTGTGVDTLRGGNGADVITAGGGDDVFQTYFHESFGDTLNGGDGIDVLGTYANSASTSNSNFDVWLNAATTLNSIERIDGSIPGTTDKELRLDGTGTFDLSSVTHFLDITDVYSNATTGSLTLLLPNLVSTDRFFLDDGADVTVEIATNTVSGSATIYLGSGYDRVTGGPGNDEIYLGTGIDTLVLYDGFNTGFGDDNIYQFSAGGSDKLDVSLLTDSSGGTVSANEVISESVSGGVSTRLIFPNGERLVLHNVAYSSMDEESEIGAAMVNNGSGLTTDLVVSDDVAVFDPLAEGLFFVPGNDVIRFLTITNTGSASTSLDSIVLIVKVPDKVDFYYGDIDDGGPETDAIAFEQSAGGGMSFTYATDVAFSNSVTKPTTMGNCNYMPSVGYDSAVTFICLNPKGHLMNGDPDPFITLSYRSKIQ